MRPLRIALLSGGNGWHVRDLQRAATTRGHQSTVVDFEKLSAAVVIGAKPFSEFDAIIVRTMPAGSLEQVVFRMDLLHQAQDRGLCVLNPPRALETCIDKYLASAKLEFAGLLVPPTIVCQTAEDALAAFEQLGGDVVVKPLFGAEGRGMMRISDRELAWRTFRTLERTGSVLYLQKFIAHPGWDLRVFVLDGRVLAGMKRFSLNDWRTNVAQGGRVEAIEVEPPLTRTAIAAAQTCSAVASGVDLLLGPDGRWYVIEVNAVPGWRALAPATGIDVASSIIECLEQRLR